MAKAEGNPAKHGVSFEEAMAARRRPPCGGGPSAFEFTQGSLRCASSPLWAAVCTHPCSSRAELHAVPMGPRPLLWGRVRVGGRAVPISLARKHALTFPVRATSHPGPPYLDRRQGGWERGEDQGGGSRCPRGQARRDAFDNLAGPRDLPPCPPPQAGAGAPTSPTRPSCSKLSQRRSASS